MAPIKLALRLISICIAGLFAAKGGVWWVLAAMYVLTAIAPIRPKGTRFALVSCVAITAGLAIAFVVVAIQTAPSPLLGLLTIYGGAQIVQEWLFGKTKGAASAKSAPP